MQGWLNDGSRKRSHSGTSAVSGEFVVVAPAGASEEGKKYIIFLFHLIYVNKQASGKTQAASRPIPARLHAASPRGRKAAHLNLGSDSKLPFLC